MKKNVTDDVFFEIAESLGVVSKAPRGWNMELNRVAWNGCRAKIDIRQWSPNHNRMARGVVLEDVEMANLYKFFLHWKNHGTDHDLKKVAKRKPKQRIGDSLYVDIYVTICRLSKNPDGWSKNLNVARWNDGDIKYDIRTWAPDNSRMGRGLTFTEEEMQKICDLYWEHEKDRLAKEIFDEAV